jgi:hypothetical protein
MAQHYQLVQLPVAQGLSSLLMLPQLQVAHQAEQQGWLLATWVWHVVVDKLGWDHPCSQHSWPMSLLGWSPTWVLIV